MNRAQGKWLQLLRGHARHQLRLGNGGAGESDPTVRHLDLGDIHAFVNLDVRPHGDAIRFARFAADLIKMFKLETKASQNIAERIESAMKSKKSGQPDAHEVQQVKTLIRRSEAIAAGGALMAFTIGRWRSKSPASTSTDGTATSASDINGDTYDPELRRRLERELRDRI